MPELRRDRAADVQLVTGAAGTGKSWYLKHRVLNAALRRRSRIVIWDWKEDHWEQPTVTLPELARRILSEPILRYVPRRVDAEPQFELFCKIAWAAQQHDPATDCVVLVEEAQKVLRAGIRNEPWADIVEVGRAYGFVVVAATPRPAYVDLGFRSAANFVRCGRLGEEEDARVMGRRLGVPYGEIQRLPDKWAYECDARKSSPKTELVKPRSLRT